MVALEKEGELVLIFGGGESFSIAQVVEVVELLQLLVVPYVGVIGTQTDQVVHLGYTTIRI